MTAQELEKYADTAASDIGYIDVHCHLTGGEYGNLSDLVSKIQAAGVKKVITAGFDIPSSEVGAELSERFGCVYFTAGFHPTELSKYREGDLDKIAALLSHPKCVALGEIGLDYHYEDTNKPLQHEMFLRQIELADKFCMPVEIHSRDCAEDMYRFLSDHVCKIRHGALLHCYSHSPELAKEFCKLGIYFSFGGTSTWKGSKRAKKSIAALPIDKLLTETDSPYLAPASAYGTFPNTPASIPEIAANMAQIKEMPEEELKIRVWQNAHALFPKLGGAGV